jgi:hypothetical protein
MMSDENKKEEPKVQANNNSIAVGSISVGGDVSGSINVAGGHIIQAAAGATVIIGAPVEAASSLMALRELMQNSTAVQNAVIEFQVDFKVAHEQVDSLGDYKDLHDLLHHLQFHCYNGIAQSVTNFPSDELTLNSLADYELTLDEIVTDLKRVAVRPSISNLELTWVEDVNLAKTDLHNAVDTLDEKFLKKAIWRLNRVLSIQPARVNALLNHSARALQLPSLLSALTRLSEHLAALDLDQTKVTAFQTGVEAMEKIDQGLTLLINEHDYWQALDVELRRIDASLEHDLTELEMSWNDVKLKAEPLYVTRAEEWANALKGESAVLDASLSANNNPAKVRRSFRSYQRRASNQFFQVDKKLKALCGNLRQIGAPLASILEMIK